MAEAACTDEGSAYTNDQASLSRPRWPPLTCRPFAKTNSVGSTQSEAQTTNTNPKDPAMNEHSITSQPAGPIPTDDLKRQLKLARPNTDESLPHIGLVGDTYTVLISGEDTNGRYCLIDMHVPPGGGPPPHRHDFEESFTVLEGEIGVTFRGEKLVVRSGETVNIPANAPHSFKNASHKPARLLCLCAPAGQEEFFAQVGVPVASRTTPPLKLDEAAQAEFMKKAEALTPRYRTELLKP
jgi:quercetin dioxygenase-like cupin family protein